VSRRLLYSFALLILLGGLALALFVVPAGSCPMDSDCAANLPRALVAIGAGLAAFVVAIIGMFREAPFRPTRRSPH
jgi:hypothetical protein